MSTQILRFATDYALYAGFITFSFGMIGNLLNIVVFTQLKQFRNNNYAFYLCAESTANLLYQFHSIALTTLTSIYGDDATGRSVIWCKLRYSTSQTFVLTTCYSICAAAVDLYFSTNLNTYLRQTCTMRLAKCTLGTLVCLWIIHGVVSSFFYDVNESQGCVTTHPVFLRYSTYFFYPVLINLLHITIGAFFAVLAFRNVRRIVRRQLPLMRRRLDRQMTAMVLVRVTLQAAFGLPYGIYRIYAISNPASREKPMEFAVARLIQAISLSIVALNYAMSFFVYVILFSRFRRQVKYVLTKKLWFRCKVICCSATNRLTPENEDSFNRNTELR